MSPFEVVQAIQSAGVGVVGLDSRRTVVVLRSVDDKDVDETAVIRFRCASQRIEKFNESHGGEVKPPVPPSPIQTYKPSWISTTTIMTATANEVENEFCFRHPFTANITGPDSHVRDNFLYYNTLSPTTM